MTIEIKSKEQALEYLSLAIDDMRMFESGECWEPTPENCAAIRENLQGVYDYVDRIGF